MALHGQLRIFNPTGSRAELDRLISEIEAKLKIENVTWKDVVNHYGIWPGYYPPMEMGWDSHVYAMHERYILGKNN